MPRGIASLTSACQRGDVREICELVKAGHSVNQRDPRGYTPLHHATCFNRNKAISLLYNLGADFNAVDSLGKLPIMDSFGGMRASSFTIIQHYTLGATLLPQNLNGDTILHDACRNGCHDFAKLVLSLEPRLVNIKDEADKVPLMVLINSFPTKQMVKTLLAHGADVNIPDGHLRTSVHYVAEVGYQDVMEMFLYANADLDSVSEQGWTPLHAAMSYRQYPMVNMLIEAGAKVDYEDTFGETALFNACRENDRDLFELLLQHQPIDIHKTNVDGCTPMELARIYGRADMLQTLQRFDRGQAAPSMCVPVPSARHNLPVRPRPA